MQTTPKISRITTNLFWDGLILAGLLVSFSPPLTGESLHEWIGLAFGGTLMVHILLHWRWIAATTRRFFQQRSWRARVNYLLGAALFIAFTLILFSGLMDSRTVANVLGLQTQRSSFWSWLHRSAADWTIWLVGAHIALHWKWIISAFKNLFQKVARSLRPAQTEIPVPIAVTVPVDPRSR